MRRDLGRLRVGSEPIRVAEPVNWPAVLNREWIPATTCALMGASTQVYAAEPAPPMEDPMSTPARSTWPRPARAAALAVAVAALVVIVWATQRSAVPPDADPVPVGAPDAAREAPSPAAGAAQAPAEAPPAGARGKAGPVKAPTPSDTPSSEPTAPAVEADRSAEAPGAVAPAAPGAVAPAEAAGAVAPAAPGAVAPAEAPADVARPPKVRPLRPRPEAPPVMFHSSKAMMPTDLPPPPNDPPPPRILIPSSKAADPGLFAPLVEPQQQPQEAQ
ncbi:MAG: hypothetical protein AMXMBFR64_26370 [Myxococcales bacterium]